MEILVNLLFRIWLEPAGGSIKNVAVSAAFRAVEDNSAITMKHLVLAMKREYQKLGKVCGKDEFERYYDWIR